MKFLALFKRDLREAAPWLALSALAVLLVCGNELREVSRHSQGTLRAISAHMSGGPNPWYLLEAHRLGGSGLTILLAGAGLGITLAALQYLMPGLLKTWPFTLHRSITRSGILLARMAAAATGMAVGVGGLWTLLFVLAFRTEAMRWGLGLLLAGWWILAVGLVVYLGAAVTSLGAARWYTTRFFPLLFALGAIATSMAAEGVTGFLIPLLVAVVILVPQLVNSFLNREY